MRAIYVKSTLSVEVVELTEPVFKSLHILVGGMFEVARPRGLNSPFVMIVNESGLLLDLPLNPVGCIFYETFSHGVPIVGDIVIMKEGPVEDGEYDLVGLSEFEADCYFDFICGMVSYLK